MQYLIALRTIQTISLFRISPLNTFILSDRQGSEQGIFSNKYIHNLKKHSSKWHIENVCREPFIRVVFS